MSFRRNIKIKNVFFFSYFIFTIFAGVISKTKLAVYRFVAKCPQNFDISTFCGVVGVLEKHIYIGRYRFCKVEKDIFRIESRMQLAIYF